MAAPPAATMQKTTPLEIPLVVLFRILPLMER
jgi:hypothetical protein